MEEWTIKITIWLGSFVSGMVLVSSILLYKQGFIGLALTQFILVLVTILFALNYLKEYKDEVIYMSEWTNFMKGKMSRYMKKYGSHKKAMKALSHDYKRMR